MDPLRCDTQAPSHKCQREWQALALVQVLQTVHLPINTSAFGRATSTLHLRTSPSPPPSCLPHPSSLSLTSSRLSSLDLRTSETRPYLTFNAPPRVRFSSYHSCTTDIGARLPSTSITTPSSLYTQHLYLSLQPSHNPPHKIQANHVVVTLPLSFRSGG